MKRIERRHLKKNELAQSLSAAREFIEPRRKQITTTVVMIVVLAVVVLGITLFRRQTQSRGQELLAQAMVALNARVVPATSTGQSGDLPAAAQFGATGTFATEEAKLNAALPKLKAAADAFPDSPAGITARYHYASSLAALGRNADAITEYESVETRAGKNSLYGRMARLGKADAQSHAGQIDAAIAALKDLAGDTSSDLPQDAILMQLARAYVQKGNTAEAKKTFTEVVDKHPDSPYLAEARTELDNLKG
jgi:tetratricopeptide (TPR) repeat protein